LSAIIHVLLVDDEEQFVLNLGKLLESRGFKMSTAFDGFQAVDAVQNTEGFDVIVMDVKMPGMDGINALKRIKQLAPATEVIMLTGHATLKSGIQAIREGAFDYLMKPCDIEDLTAKIQEAYAVETIKRHPVLWPRNKVEELICYTFERLDPDGRLADALDVLKQENGARAAETAYILDSEDRLLGFITKRDLIEAARETCPEFSLTWTALRENPDWLPPKRLRDVMHSRILYCRPDELLSDVAHQMITNKFRTMPVIDQGKVVGVVRLQDIFVHLEHEIE
jgi:CheY-like chemotaxis protein/CBS domain-containing protein